MADREALMGYVFLVVTATGLVPVFTIVGANALLGDPLTLLHAAGGLLVLAGIVLPAWARSRAADPRDEPGRALRES